MVGQIGKFIVDGEHVIPMRLRFRLRKSTWTSVDVGARAVACSRIHPLNVVVSIQIDAFAAGTSIVGSIFAPVSITSPGVLVTIGVEIRIDDPVDGILFERSKFLSENFQKIVF